MCDIRTGILHFCNGDRTVQHRARAWAYGRCPFDSCCLSPTQMWVLAHVSAYKKPITNRMCIKDNVYCGHKIATAGQREVSGIGKWQARMRDFANRASMQVVCLAKVSSASQFIACQREKQTVSLKARINSTGLLFQKPCASQHISSQANKCPHSIDSMRLVKVTQLGKAIR